MVNTFPSVTLVTCLASWEWPASLHLQFFLKEKMMKNWKSPFLVQQDSYALGKHVYNSWLGSHLWKPQNWRRTTDRKCEAHIASAYRTKPTVDSQFCPLRLRLTLFGPWRYTSTQQGGHFEQMPPMTHHGVLGCNQTRLARWKRGVHSLVAVDRKGMSKGSDGESSVR